MKIGWGEKVGYSLGDVTANLVFQMMMIYQLKFYTDVFGLSGAVAGTVMLIAPFVGALADPLAGLLADRTNTRWGKYRPWMLWTALPYAVFYVLSFTNPGIENKALVALYATISYILLLAMYSMNNTPYASLGGVMTSDIHERTSLNTVRFVASTIAQFVVQGLTLPLVHKFGNGNEAHGWSSTILLFAIVAMLCSIITFLTTKERIAPPPQQTGGVRQDVRQTFGSKPWRLLFVLTLLLYIGLAVWSSGMNYYFQNYVDQASLYNFLKSLGLVGSAHAEEGWFTQVLAAFHLIAYDEHDAYAIGFSLFNMTNAVVQLIGVVALSGLLGRKLGKKTTFIVCLTLTTVFTLLFRLPQKADVETLFVLCALKSLAYAPTIPLFWAMVADTADYMEYIHGRRATGFCFSGVVCALKLGLGLGGALAGMMLSLFGYASGGMAVQSPQAIGGIRLMASLIPATLFALGVLVLCFYPITEKRNRAMQEELSRRRAEAKAGKP
jgi:GPH family glycoside/pentoside/hexuronide:cation symporter